MNDIGTAAAGGGAGGQEPAQTGALNLGMIRKPTADFKPA